MTWRAAAVALSHSTGTFGDIGKMVTEKENERGKRSLPRQGIISGNVKQQMRERERDNSDKVLQLLRKKFCWQWKKGGRPLGASHLSVQFSSVQAKPSQKCDPFWSFRVILLLSSPSRRSVNYNNRVLTEWVVKHCRHKTRKREAGAVGAIDVTVDTTTTTTTLHSVCTQWPFFSNNSSSRLNSKIE